MGIGDSGLAQRVAPCPEHGLLIPNPQSPITNPQAPIPRNTVHFLLPFRASTPNASTCMTTSRETDWMNHPAIRALVDAAARLTPPERITMVKGLIPALADALPEDEFDEFIEELRVKGERYREAKNHPGEGRAQRRTPGEKR